jgi:hypothetical protein
MGDLLKFPHKPRASCYGCPNPGPCVDWLKNRVPPWDPSYVPAPECLNQMAAELIGITIKEK